LPGGEDGGTKTPLGRSFISLIFRFCREASREITAAVILDA